jgi:RNA polymerase sigma-70 factor (ECF subfamily)
MQAFPMSSRRLAVLSVDKPAFSRHGVARRRIAVRDLMDNTQSPDLSSAGVLIQAIGRGSRVALKRLYELESRRLYGIALRIVRRPEVAADVLQEAFIQVWQNAKTFSSERGAGAAWLTGIVRFRALDAVRKLGREVLSDDPALGDTALEPDVIDRLDAQAEAGALQRCLGLLDDRQRRCVVLAFVDGFSHAEIAERLAAPLGSVKSWVRRGLLALRSCLES